MGNFFFRDSLFFKFCYNNAKKSKDNLQDRLAGLLFIEVLIKFLKTPTKQLASRRTVFCSFSNAIHSKILNEFCIKSGSSM